MPTSDFSPTIWILLALVAGFLFALGFAMRKFTVAITGVEPGEPLPLQDHSHTTPFE